jgi:predicted nucleic acid-binding protein
MPLYVLDTSELIAQIVVSTGGGHSLSQYTEQDAIVWAEEVIDFRRTNAIVTPVFIELLAGARNAHELKLFRAYLSRFRIIDDGRVVEKDWRLASQIAARVPRDGKRRQLVDCLIRAMSDRLNFEIITRDKRFFW